MISVKSAVRRAFAAMGYDLSRITGDMGQNPYYDMRAIAGRGPGLMVMDVGANVGQSIERFRENFDRPVIHSFEPGRHAFAELRRRTSGVPDLHLNNCAVGSRPGTMEFNENVHSDMSSFLTPGRDCWGEVKERVRVDVRTLETYCAAAGIGAVDILKTDTQGFDLEVIKGAGPLLASRLIHLICMEITFADLYKGLPRLDEIYAFMTDNGFSLVSFYQFHFKNGRAGWTDALFVNPEYRPGDRHAAPAAAVRDYGQPAANLFKTQAKSATLSTGAFADPSQLA